MVSGGIFVVWLMLAIRGVILRLKKQGRLRGSFKRDRRLILHALGGLGLTALLPTAADTPAGITRFARPIMFAPKMSLRPEMEKLISKMVTLSFDSVFSREEAVAGAAPGRL